MTPVDVTPEPQNSAPLSAASSSPAAEKRGAAWRYCSIAMAASECGITARHITKDLIPDAKSESDAGRPTPLIVRTVRGDEWQVQPGAVYDWIVERHARGLSKRLPPNLCKPAGYEDPRTQTSGTISAADAGVVDFSDFDKFVADLARDEKMPKQTKEFLLRAGNLYRLNKDSEEKRQAKIPRENVRKMLRAHADLCKEEHDAHAPAFAVELLSFIHRTFNVDLAARNPTALQQFECFYRENINGLFVALEKCVADQLAGVRDLNLEGSASAN